MLKQAEESPEARGKVFKELFELSTDYKQVANFLTEIVANIFPADFLEGKNKKIFNKKVLQFVKFNRFESFTRITILHKFRLHEIKWMQFKANKDTFKYFINENQWVFYKILKWIFEDLFVS